ncbi:hypothetical protein K3N28_18835 [Glycomyces sp. TRM65418]|uniref:hypothetical protein n=1 Tax=Glycomyces sp. TRM65418 TaxID=2867006 RepID=UPI001CE58528|nr:hypothetical protein [Glycomyces sp. TRM65418]MCC3765120.1 hypothetical protein [Glycomyces sp. TRM65418]QZD54749.1 hypothetical protein K3N28_18745 [Glycomyces sp. TRM65418]
MTDTDSLRQELYRIRSQLKGEARTAALEAHLEKVEAHGDQMLVNRTLTELVDCYEYSTDSSRLIVPFSRLLRAYDEAPEHFDASLVRSVYWQFKWVVYDLIDRPEIPLSSIEDWMEDWRVRYAEAGHSLHPLHEAEHCLAQHLGDADRAARAAEALHATEPDGMSDCAACRCGYLGRVAFAEGDHLRALEHWRPVFDGGMRCMHEPHRTLSFSTFAAARAGRLDQARSDHVRGYQMSRGNDDMVAYIARHMRFCAFTGNEPRSLEILAANASAFAAAIAPRTRLEVLESLQSLCDALVARGMGDADMPEYEGRIRTAAELRAAVDLERRALCERFDRRNGTSAVSRDSMRRVAPAEPYPHVPLGLKTAPMPAPRPFEREAAGGRASEAETMEGLRTALERARAATAAFAADHAQRWAAVDRLAAALDVALAPGDEAEVLLARIEPNGDGQAALALAARAQDLFSAAGLPDRALTNRAATLQWRLGVEPDAVPAAAAAVLAEAAALADSHPVAALRARALAHIALLAHCRVAGTEPSGELLADAAAIDAELASDPEEPRYSQARVRLALTMTGFATEARARLEAMRTAFELAVAGDHHYETFIASTQYASLLSGSGAFEAGLEAAETGLARAQPGYPHFPIAALHLTAAECATNLDRPAKAETHAVQAAHHYDRAAEHGCAGVARHLLGVALAAQDRHPEAVVMLEAALEDLPAMPEEEHWRLVDARAMLARSHERLAEARPGLAHALEALRLMEGGLAHPDPTRYARTAQLAGRLLQWLGEPGDAARAFGRSEQAWRELGALPAAADPARRAIWAELRRDAEDEGAALDVASARMRALAEELRSEWQHAQRPPEHRAECRFELATTLLQHANLQLPDASETGRLALAERRRLLEQALAVAEDGEYLPGPGVQATTQLMLCLDESGEPEAASDALAEAAFARLDPEPHPLLRQQLKGALAQVRRQREG